MLDDHSRCPNSLLCLKGRPRHIHGLPHDGRPAGKGLSLQFPGIASLLTFRRQILQWVNDIADAGGALYCFHLEATCTRIDTLMRTPAND